MELIADIMLAAGALGAGFYCFVLGRRLSRFNNLEEGIGGAVAVLSSQVDDLTRTLTTAREQTRQSTEKLTKLTARAQTTSQQLELQMASLHDIPKPINDSEFLTTKKENKTNVEQNEIMFVRSTKGTK